MLVAWSRNILWTLKFVFIWRYTTTRPHVSTIFFSSLHHQQQTLVLPQKFLAPLSSSPVYLANMFSEVVSSKTEDTGSTTRANTRRAQLGMPQDIVLKMKRLQGSKPSYEAVDHYFIDHEKEEVILFLSNQQQKIWQLATLNLKTWRWQQLKVRH
jgi:hypothetical protein